MPLTPETIFNIKARCTREFAKGMKSSGHQSLNAADVLAILAAYEEQNRELAEWKEGAAQAAEHMGATQAVLTKDRDDLRLRLVKAGCDLVKFDADLEQARQLLKRSNACLLNASVTLRHSWLRHFAWIRALAHGMDEMHGANITFLVKKEGAKP